MPPTTPQTITPQTLVTPKSVPPPKKSGSKGIIRFFIIIILVGAAGYFGYKFFLSNTLSTSSNTNSGDGLVTTAGNGVGNSATPDLSKGATTASADQIGNDFLTTLLSVRSIKIDSTIFTSQAFTSLQDFSRPLLPDNNPGRPNPFAPLGSDTTTVSTQISTTNASAILTTTATLNGTLTIADEQTVRWFEYGASQDLGTKTLQKTQKTPGTFAETVTGLLPNTTYYVKAMATYGGQTIAGNIISFKTAQAIR